MALILRGSYIVKPARGEKRVQGHRTEFLLVKMLVCPHHSSHGDTKKKPFYLSRGVRASSLTHNTYPITGQQLIDVFFE